MSASGEPPDAATADAPRTADAPATDGPRTADTPATDGPPPARPADGPADQPGPDGDGLAHAGTSRPPARWDRPRTWPWWAQALGVYALGRLFTTLALLVVARSQDASGWAGAHPSYWQFTGIFWDADWYRQAAEHLYPAELPRGEDGLVQQNVWAFFPLFPLLVRGLMTVTRGPWEVVAPLTATVLGAAAAVVVHRLVAAGAPRAVAARPGLPLATVTLLAVFPTSPVLQVGYTESLALLLVALALLTLVRRQYLLCGLVVVLLGFTRAVALPMAVVVGVHLLLRWWHARRGEDRLSARDVGGLLVLGGAAVVSGVAWPTICGWVTGVPDGYLQTQEAWRGVREVKPFGAWGYVSQFWFGDRAPWVLLAAFAFVVAVLVVPAAWRLGRELHAWSAAYVLYIAAVVEPGSSMARFLLLAFPLGAVTAGVVTRPAAARRWWLAGVVVLMLGLQLVWIWNFWRLTPPTGWPP